MSSTEQSGPCGSPLTEGLGPLVPQRATYDCVLACLAMATGRDYDDLWPQGFRDAVEKAKGTGSGDLHERAFELAGLEAKRDYISVYCGMAPTDIVRKMIWGRRALVQVPSLNHERSSHYVYWDGERVFDPSTKQRYQWLSSMAPEWVALLRA